MTESTYRNKVQIPETAKMLTLGAMRARCLQQFDNALGISKEKQDAAFSAYARELREKYPSVK